MNLSLAIISEIISQKAVLHLPNKIIFLIVFFEMPHLSRESLLFVQVISVHCAIVHSIQENEVGSENKRSTADPDCGPGIKYGLKAGVYLLISTSSYLTRWMIRTQHL